MASQDRDSHDELFVFLEQLILVQDEADIDQDRDNYVRRLNGPIHLVSEEVKTEIGQVELIYFAGSRAVDNDLDIIEPADSVGQEGYQYARSIYADGVLDSDIVGEVAMSNDLLAVHAVSILPGHRGQNYGLRVAHKIAETVGYHCGAVVVNRESLTDEGIEPDSVAEEAPVYGIVLEFRPTKIPSIFCISHF